MSRKLHFVAFAFVLGFAVLGVPSLESLDDDEFADNDQAVPCVNEAAPRVAQERAESTRNKLFSVENASPFSLSPLFLPPTKAGRDLLQLLTLQKK